jgi:hypothetical protein
MDVEGAEPLVVAGARQLLHEDRPVVMSELHPTQLARASGTSGDHLLDAFRALRYRAHRLDEGGMVGPALERAPDDVLISVIFMPQE